MHYNQKPFFTLLIHIKNKIYLLRGVWGNQEPILLLFRDPSIGIHRYSYWPADAI